MPELVKALIKHDNYEKLVDDVFLLGKNAILRFNVTLAKYSDKFGRVGYHQEFEYFNREAKRSTITMRRDFDFYLSIENIRSDPNTPIKQFLMITVNDILGFRAFLDDIVKWFTAKEFDGLYATKNNELVMTKRVPTIAINVPPSNSYIMAEPMICVNKFNEKYQGVRLYLSSETNYVEMSLTRIQGLRYLVSSIDMYNCACSLINYLQRPEMGTNLTSYSSEYRDNTYEPEKHIPVTPNTGRKVQNRKLTIQDL